MFIQPVNVFKFVWQSKEHPLKPGRIVKLETARGSNLVDSDNLEKKCITLEKTQKSCKMLDEKIK